MEIPEDVKEFLEELKRRGIKPSLVAVEREKKDDGLETYDVWIDGKYVGILPSDDVFRESNFVACGKLTCACFVSDTIKYVWQREKRRLYEPEEW